MTIPFVCPECRRLLNLQLTKHLHCEFCKTDFLRLGSGFDFVSTKISNIEKHKTEDKEYWRDDISYRLVEPPLMKNTALPMFIVCHNDDYVNSYYEYKRLSEEYALRLLSILTNFIQKHINPNSKFSILDIGSGLGPTHHPILNHFPNLNLIGIEIVPSMVIAAQNYSHPRAEYHRGDAYHLPFANNSFDIVYSQNAIEHAGPEMVKEAARVLKPDGFSLIVGPGYIANLTQSPYKILKFATFQEPNIHGYKLAFYLKLFKEAGLKIISYDSVCFNSMQRTLLQRWMLNPKLPKPPNWLVDLIFGFNGLMERILKKFGCKAWLWMQIFELHK